MNLNYLPFYLSRAILSGLFCIAIFGFTFEAGLWAVAIFLLMVFYLHSGWFTIDMSRPFFPLKRDQYALNVQRKSLVVAVAIPILVRLLLKVFPSLSTSFPFLETNLLSIGVLLYFLAQSIQFVSSRLKSRTV